MKSYVTFALREERPKNRKTDVYVIKSRRDNFPLAIIKWSGAWRRYCFFPNDDTIWSVGCMAEVSAFIDGLMEARRKRE